MRPEEQPISEPLSWGEEEGEGVCECPVSGSPLAALGGSTAAGGSTVSAVVSQHWPGWE